MRTDTGAGGFILLSIALLVFLDKTLRPRCFASCISCTRVNLVKFVELLTGGRFVLPVSKRSKFGFANLERPFVIPFAASALIKFFLVGIY